MIMAKTSAESEKTDNQQDVPSSLTEEETKAIASLSYEQARDRLVQAVQTLETGGLDLEDSVHQWELGEALAKRAQTLLDDVRAKLDSAQADQAAAGASAGTQGNMEQA
ncbi:MAG: exodeoxyribonuclease VII small subunit [Parascardovia denticolens]